MNAPRLTPSSLPVFFARHGFLIVLAAVAVYFGLASDHFLSAGNLIAMLHSMAPVVAIAAGLGLVVLMGNLDISVGSVAFLSVAIGVLLMTQGAVSPVLAFAITLLCGALLGALNGFIVVVIGINSLITTLGTMIALRGIALHITNASVIPLPEEVRRLGNLSLGPIFVDILVIAAIVVAVHLLHQRTPFGRQLTAVGNSADVSARLGLPVRAITFATFVLSGVLASVGGIVSVLQVGSLSAYMGQGLEFTALAVVVIGGISLFGGRGAILPGVVLGALTFEMIRNGLNQIGANPYAYRLVTGALIFLAMYADALRSGLPTAARLKRPARGEPARSGAAD